jgi:hypothetical protein
MPEISRALLIFICFSFGSVSFGQQAKTEQRIFRVKVEDREAGFYKQVITSYSEGTTDLTVQSDVNVKVLGVSVHQFAYRAQERWKEGRLLYLASASNKNGTTHTLMVTAENSRLKIKDAGPERFATSDSWSTSYWLLPPADRREKPMVLIDADSGQAYRVQWQALGKETLAVGQQKVVCTHYKVTGDAQVDLWFDAKDHLVRREMMREGRKTVVELVSVN